VNAITTGEATTRRAMPREMAKILDDCRDLAIHRLLLSFASMLDHVSDHLMARAGNSDIRDEQLLFLDAREVLRTERPSLMAEFDRQLRLQVDAGVKGDALKKADFSTLDAGKLTLVDTLAMDESIVSGNIVRVVENLCHDELLEFNRAVGYLLGRPELETATNPLAPSAIVHAFTEALRSIKGDQRIKYTILKELNQSSLGDINAIYADLNRHLESLHVVPRTHSSVPHRAAGRPGDRRPGADGQHAGPQPPEAAAAPAEVDMMAMLQRLASRGFGLTRLRQPGMPQGMPPGGIQVPPAGPGMLGGFQMPAGDGREMPLSIGQFGGPRILVTQELGDALSRLQQGESGFDVGGVPVQFAGVPEGMHNVLRDLQESPLGAKANQLEAMTIELVAMLFDFIFETKDLPDSMKVLIGRLQIPVLKAAMLDGAFFSKKSHPSRLMVNALAHAGIGWSPAMGSEDPLFKKVEQIVHRVLDEFTDDVYLFETLRKDLETFLAEEEKNAETTIQSTADEINQRDRQEIARMVARSEIEKRLETQTVPNFLGSFLRDYWINVLAQLHLQGEESETWVLGLTTLDDLVWSVQPKRTGDERRKLVAMLPNLLKRLHRGLQNVAWEPGEREQFMANLVEAHAASVKPSLASVPMPTTAVAEAAAAAAEEASAKGDTATAAKARALADAMAPAPPPPPPPEPAVEIVQDHFAELAASLERGMWIEFEGEDGQLAFAKLAWVSPLRGTYLFTNRQGQKAVSLTADELADRFRKDRARLVEAEPLIDRAFVSMMASLEEKFGEQPA
jgi:hypothetical protein